ncbi:MAG: hypothetical protein QOK23_920 [Gammaproteobacteria bacterium]|jgi:hypothetical protein|nr:hypothetical protein [Gammaproteobacteria bacterium]
MAILIPNSTITRRWAGALQASMQRAPLERFLRSRGLHVAARGPAQDSDNIARTCVYVLDKGVGFYFRDGAAALSGLQMPIIGRVACQVCFNLGLLIAEPQAWRVPALVGTAQLLSRHTDLAAAASISAAAARDFTSKSCLPLDPSDLGPRASAAVGRNDEGEIEEVAKLMARFLIGTPATEVNTYGGGGQLALYGSHVR